MLPPFDPWRTAQVAAELPFLAQAPPAWRARRAAERLASLLHNARERSPFWRERLRGFDTEQARLSGLPVMDKATLMANFDAAVCDEAVRLDTLRAFLADPAGIGDACLGRYVVWESSGSTGEPAVFVQDAGAMAVYDALEALRRSDWQRWLSPASAHEHLLFLGATGGHFASTVSVARLRRLNPWVAPRLHSLSFLQPVAQVVAQVDAIAPRVIATYPTAAVLLADEYRAGLLKSRPREVWTGGETLTAAMRQHIEQAFGCTVRDSYGASEFLSLAWECEHGRLHLNDDWALLEPVDEDGRPVPPGQVSTTVLLTNLANHVQPLIRHDLGDRVALHPSDCRCGSTLPIVQVEGRTDDTLHMRGDDGRVLSLLPLALCTVLEDEAGLFDFQVRRRGERALELRLGDDPALSPGAAERGVTVLRTFLAAQGAAGVEVTLSVHRGGQRGRSGKVPRVVAAA